MNTQQILYKYFPESRHQFFYKPMLRFTPPKDLNDPFEARPSYKGLASHGRFADEFDNIIDETLMEQIQCIPSVLHSFLNKEAIKDMMRKQVPLISDMASSKEIRKKIDDTIASAIQKTCPGILSLSQVKDNLLMWAHYCQDHKGFVVGFDASHSFFDRRLSDNDPFRHLRRVAYAIERPQKHIMDYSSGDSIFEDLFFTKSKDWEYESEWRMVIAGVDGMTQYGIPGLDAVPVEAIKEVYIGVKSNRVVNDCALSFCRENGLSAIYQMELHEENYALKHIPIDV